VYIKFDSAQQAEQLSRTLFLLTVPEGAEVISTHLFGWFDHEGQTIAEIDSFKFKVHLQANTESLMADLATLLGDKLTDTEAEVLGGILRRGAVDLLDIIPSGIERITPTFNTKNII